MAQPVRNPRMAIYSDGKIDGWVVEPASLAVTVDRSAGIHIRVSVADEVGIIVFDVEQWCEFIDTINDKIVDALDLDPGAGHG